MKTRYVLLTLGLLAQSGLGLAETVVTAERNAGSDWKFSTVPRPSRSDLARTARISLAGADKEMSCLSADGLHNGVLPWQGRHKRDFFAFSNFDARDGMIVMDLGKVQPVTAVVSYSWHERVMSLDGTRSPQVFTLYGSADEHADPAKLSTWVRISAVDTRDKGWGGQHASFIRDDKGAPLGEFRWLLWEVKRTKPGGGLPNVSHTWFTELDVHTAGTFKTAGDAIMAGSQLDELVLGFKTHFDIGFTHRAPEIVSIYRTDFIDRALKLIDDSRALAVDRRFVWTIPSWVLYQILWPGQDPLRRARIVQAVKDGSLVVHALPVTLQTESLDLEVLASGLDLHTKLAREIGFPLSRAGKMTDVPSHSWILPTLLGNAGIEFLHIGCNPCNERPDVPLLYHWEGPDGSRILTFLNQGYGSGVAHGLSGLYPPKDWPYKHWLTLCTGSDNTPPPDPAAVQALFAELKRNLPTVKVKLGKMEDFSDAIKAEEKAGASVPVVRADMPDCWIHGMGSMPAMDALARRVRSGSIAVESLDSHLRIWGQPRPEIRKQLAQAQERSLMYGEHTWGGAANLQGRNAYADKNFENTITTDSTCKYLQQTWDDHADYIRTAAAISDKLEQQELNQLAAGVNVEGDRLVVFNPLPRLRDAIVEVPGKPGHRLLIRDLPPSGYRTVAFDSAVRTEQAEQADSAVLENALLRVTVDRRKGGVVSMVDKQTGRELIDTNAKYAFGQYLYQRFDRKQEFEYDSRCEHLDSVHGFCTGWNIRADLPGNVPYTEAVPAYGAMTTHHDGVAQVATLTAAASGLIASKVTTTITLPDHAAWLEIGIRLDEKKPDYWPEAGGFFLPVNASNPQFRIGRLGGVADPAKDFARNSNRTYGMASNGALIADAAGKGVGIYPLDHSMMSFGTKGLNTIDPDYVPTTPVATVSMFNNLWTINFPYWIQGTVQSRVRIWATNDLKPSSLIEPTFDARQPVLVAIGTGAAGKLPAEQSGLALSRDGVRLTAFREDDGGTLLRVWEQVGEAGDLTVTLPPEARFTSAQPVNLRYEKMGGALDIKDGKFTFPIRAYAPASFILTPALPVSSMPDADGAATSSSGRCRPDDPSLNWAAATCAARPAAPRFKLAYPVPPRRANCFSSR